MQSRSFPLIRKGVWALALMAMAVAVAQAQNLKSFEQRITTKVLRNGLTLIICERPEAPVFSYSTFIDAGDVNDPSGESGLAHMFEHLAFKGTSQIGTTDYAAEKIALEKVEAANNAYEAEYLKAVGRDEKKLAELKKTFMDAQTEAHKYVIPNQFTDVAERNGAEGLNAETGLDETMYYWSMPENRLELWAWLESGRLADVAPREFYKERDVVNEERRMRTDSNPIGRLVEQFLATAYVAHNYGRSGIGWPSEVEPDQRHRGHGVPQKILRRLEHRDRRRGRRESFRSPAGAGKILQPHSRRSQAGGDDHRRAEAVCREDGGDSRADAALLHRGLPPARLPQPRRCGLRRHQRHYVQRPRLAPLSQPGSRPADCRRGRRIQPFPGEKYPSLFAFYAVPLPGHTPAQMRDAIHKEIDKLKTADVSDEELAMFKTRTRADLLRGLANNQGLANSLAEYQTRYGDWRELFLQLDKVDKVSKADIRRVANEIFIPSNRTEAWIETEAAAAEKSAATQHDGGAQ